MDAGSFTISGDLEDAFSVPCVPYHRPLRRTGSYRSTAPPARSSAAAAPGFFWDEFFDDEPHGHFLESCFLCRMSLAGNRDIFMYRGDAPFCSEECRQQQIEIDEAKERRTSWKLRSSSKQQQEQRESSSAAASPDSQKVHVTAAGTVVAG